MLFLDMTLMKFANDRDCFKMTYNGVKDFSDTQMGNRASAVKNSADGIEYLTARKQQLQGYYFSSEEEDLDKKFEFDSGFRNKVMQKLSEAIDDSGSPLHNDAVKTAWTKIAKDFQSEDEIIDPPLRVLAESCRSCRYKLFVENNTVDECVRCKYRKFSNSEGIFYDHKDMLESE